MDTSLQSFDQIRASALDMAVRFGPKVIVAILIMCAGYVVGRWVGRGLARLLMRLKLEAPVRSLLVRIAQICVLAIFAIMALQNLGIELLPLIAGLGVAGAGVALAMQGILGNIVAGLSIIFTRPFHVGDYISIAKEEGEVLDISLFTTTLGHTDLSRVVIPNRKIVGEILHNYGQIRRPNISVGISYRTDVNAALELINGILGTNPRVLKDPAPIVGVTRLSESGLTISVCPWVKVPDYDGAISEVNKAILETFLARNIALALPQYEVRMLGGTAE
ncbi:mechanosensitive ion channel family protein [Dechloromonas sp. A34]|uniref:mechanosensitive ion channel family protein n=1 Tax=Dechloromonas sp. A34 TaxID=447588 RepID=UPI0022490DDA|nr:mechanosensitive ion channel family protein [Dechloromonas sp. A34]